MPCIGDVCGTGTWTGPVPGDPDNNVILRATGVEDGIEVSWSYPTLNPHAVIHTVLRRSTDEIFANSVERAIVAGNVYRDMIPIEEFARYYYWIQIISVNGTPGEPVGPASAIPTDSITRVLSRLTAVIDRSFLAQVLQNELDRIPVLEQAITDERVARQNAFEAYTTALTAYQASLDDALATVLTEVEARTNADFLIAQQLQTAQVSLGEDIASVQTTLSADIDLVDGKVVEIGARFTAVVDVNGLIGGFGVYNDGTTIDAGFDVDTFWIGKAGVKQKPFIVSGPNVFIDNAFITALTADKIDSRGLTIKDAQGNIIFGAGNNLDWSRVAGTGKPADNASSDLTLVAHAGVSITGNKVTKTAATNGWDASAYSRDGYTGGAFCSAMAPSNCDIMFGLNTDPTTDAGYASIDYAWYFVGGGTLWIYESGAGIDTGQTYTAGSTVLAVTYDGVNVRYLKDGTVVRTVAAAANLKFYFDSCFYGANHVLSNIRFGPLTSNVWSDIGGTNKPQNGATNSFNGAPGNLIPDDGFYDPGWWRGDRAQTTWPTGWVPQSFSAAGQPHRFLAIGVTGGNFDVSSLNFSTHQGGTYRVRLKMYLTADFAGFIAPLVHVPNVIWACPGSTVVDPNGIYPNGHTAASWGTGAWYEQELTTGTVYPYMQTRFCGHITAGTAYIYAEVTTLFGGANQITSGNVSTYLANAAIGNAQIGGAIQSTDYAPGTAGWRINKDGNAELNNASFRGTLVGATGTFAGSLAAGVLDITSLVGQTTTYSSAGTYTLTVPADKTSVKLTLIGGGGGGGGGNGYSGPATGGGGGGGGKTVATFNNLTPGAQYTLTVGGGGTGGLPVDGGNWATGTDGTAGTATSVAGLASAAGGTGGIKTITQSQSGADGTSGSGGVAASGGNGGYVQGFSTGGVHGNYGVYPTQGTGFGAGGGGGGSGGSGTWGVGAAGTQGYAQVEFFNPNGVVIRSEWTTLTSALQRQGIATT